MSEQKVPISSIITKSTEATDQLSYDDIMRVHGCDETGNDVHWKDTYASLVFPPDRYRVKYKEAIQLKK